MIPKGKSGNPNGRPKGKPNKATASVRDYITMLVERRYSRIEQDLDSLDPYQRLTIIEKLIGYIVPKKSSTDISIESLPEEQLDFIIQKLIDAHEKA